MPTPSDLTQSGQALILALINEANPEMTPPASAGNVTFGTPVDRSAQPGAITNTFMVATSIPQAGYSGNVTLSYNRINPSTLFALYGLNVLSMEQNDYAEQQDLLPAINAGFNLNMQPSDLATPAAALDLSAYPVNLTLTMAPASLTYFGSFDVKLIAKQLALNSVIQITSLDGLIGPPITATGPTNPPYALPAANANWADPANPGVIRFSAGLQNADLGGTPVTCTGALSADTEAAFASEGITFTGTNGTVEGGVTAGYVFSFAILGVGGNSSAQGSITLNGTPVSDFDGRSITLTNAAGTVIYQGQMGTLLGITGADLATFAAAFTAGEYAITILPEVAEYANAATSDWTTGGGVYFKTAIQGGGSGPNGANPEFVGYLGSTVDANQNTQVGYTSANGIPWYSSTGGNSINQVATTPLVGGPTGVVLDCVLFPISVDGAPQSPGVLINFVNPPNGGTTTLNDSFAERTAKIIDSAGTVYWAGKLGDVGGNTVIPFAHQATMVQPLIPGGVYALIIDAYEVPAVNADWTDGSQGVFRFRVSDSLTEVANGDTSVTTGFCDPAVLDPSTQADQFGAVYSGDLGSNLGGMLAGYALQINVAANSIAVVVVNASTRASTADLDNRVVTLVDDNGIVYYRGQLGSISTGKSPQHTAMGTLVAGNYNLLVEPIVAEFTAIGTDWTQPSAGLQFTAGNWTTTQSSNPPALYGYAAPGGYTLTNGEMQQITDGGGAMQTVIGGPVDATTQVMIDAVLFQGDSVNHNGYTGRVVINFVTAPDDGANAVPSNQFDAIIASIIDSAGTVYWSGPLSAAANDGATLFPAPYAAGSTWIKQVENGGTYTLALNAPY
jgi:hypothetical protein